MDHLGINTIPLHCMLVLMIGLLHIVGTTSLYPLEMNPSRLVVRYGDPVSVNCSTSVADLEGMGWEASDGGTRLVVNVTWLMWTVERLEDWNGSPKCYINLKNGDQPVETLGVTLYQLPDVVSISPLNHTGPVVEGTEYQLQCDILNVAPVQNLTVTWYKGNETIKTDSYSDQSKTPVNESSILTITPSREDDGALYRCEAQLNLGPEGPHPSAIDSDFSLTVLYKPVILKCPCSFAGEEHTFSLDMNICAADGNPRPHVQWYLQGRLLNSSELLTRRNSGEYVFTATNDHGNGNSTVKITVEYAPELICPVHYEGEEGKNHNLTCSAGGMPAPTIIWSKDGKEIHIPVRLTRKDSGEYNVSAVNKHGTSYRKMDFNILYAPEFLSGEDTLELSEGGDESLVCSAEGNPPPKMEWTYDDAAGNVHVTTEGRQSTVRITGATLTNTGSYICNATNRVGTVTRMITVMMKVPPSDTWYYIVIISLIIIPLIIIIIIILCLKHHTKKQGRFTPIPQDSCQATGQHTQSTDLPLNTLSQKANGSH
ncbi:hemicentin-2-like [Hypomesus transpacificus]|uniref:hemicentin-2-like n=1 Tax=Hypomesus transpacificus TaxID=137520 RepID=UPI001F08191C|nr:hemicentin-2-like [Hypomesus transpacificus]